MAAERPPTAAPLSRRILLRAGAAAAVGLTADCGGNNQTEEMQWVGYGEPIERDGEYAWLTYKGTAIQGLIAVLLAEPKAVEFQGSWQDRAQGTAGISFLFKNNVGEVYGAPVESVLTAVKDSQGEERRGVGLTVAAERMSITLARRVPVDNPGGYDLAPIAGVTGETFLLDAPPEAFKKISVLTEPPSW